MSTDLEDDLRAHFDELARHMRVDPPTRFEPVQTAHAGLHAHADGRRPATRLIAAAAALCLIVGAVAVIQAARDRQTAPSVEIPPDGPVLFTPSGLDGAIVHSLTALDSYLGPGTSGAVKAPSGEVFGVIAYQFFGVDLDGEPRRVGSEDFRARTELAITQHVAHDDCTSVTINRSGSPGWSDDALALMAGLSIKHDRATLQLPSGWTSLGTGPEGPQYFSAIDFQKGDEMGSFQLTQRPGTPVGVFLSSMQTTVVRWVEDGLVVWFYENPLEPGKRTVITERDGTAIRLEGQGTLGPFLKILGSLERAPLSDWTSTQTPVVSVDTMAPGLPQCVAPLVIIPPP